MVTIRRVTEADVERLTPLKAEVHAMHVAARPDVFKAMSDAQIARWLRERLGEETTHAWLAEDEGDGILGYAMAAQRERGATTFSHARAWCEIDEVIVALAGRRRGVARTLIDRAAQHSRTLGVERLELTTWSFNESAADAFRRIGFRPMIGRFEW
jgi:GNAT superfamily N-acetyltransferase